MSKKREREPLLKAGTVVEETGTVSFTQKIRGTKISSNNVDDVIDLLANEHARDVIDKDRALVDNMAIEELSEGALIVKGNLVVKQDLRGAAFDMKKSSPVLKLSSTFVSYIEGLVKHGYSFELFRSAREQLTIRCVYNGNDKDDGVPDKLLEKFNDLLISDGKVNRNNIDPKIRGFSLTISCINNDRSVLHSISLLLKKECGKFMKSTRFAILETNPIFSNAQWLQDAGNDLGSEADKVECVMQ